MAPAGIPHHPWVRNEGRGSCCGVTGITRNTSAVVHGFDYPEDDARRLYAMGCKRASSQTPFAPVRRISVSAAELLLLILVAKVSPAKAHHCSRLASGKGRFATAIGSPIPRLPR